MLSNEIIPLILFAGCAVYLCQLGWNMSGIREYELPDIRQEFEEAPVFLRPLVIDATKLWRRLLRVLPLIVLNLFVLFVAYQVHRQRELSTVWQALTVIGTLEWVLLHFVARKNHNKYRADLEECRTFSHPTVNWLEGTIEDRPTGKCKANHTVRGGRIVRVLGQAGVYHDLFLPLEWYSVRRVEETDGPVQVFYLDWLVSGYRKEEVFPERPPRTPSDLDDKSRDAVGVYLGFRHNPALASKEAVWTRPLEDR